MHAMRSVAVIKKYLPVLLLSFFWFIHANGQIRLGVYGGIHSSNVIEKNNIPGWDTAQKNYYSSRSGFHIGALLEIPVHKNLFFQPGIDYVSKGRQYSKPYDTSGSNAKDTLSYQTTLKLGYIELPLLMTYKLPLTANHKNNFFISAGPYLAFFYNGSMNQQSRTAVRNNLGQIDSNVKYRYTNEDVDLPVGNAPGKYKTFDIGISTRAGFELGNVMLSAYFTHGFTNFYTADYNGTFHHQVFGGTLGIWLTRSHPPAPAPPVKKDSDKDGITDDEDACPLQPGSIAWHGCPTPDTDHDGIDDDHDSCRAIAGVARYHGCPVPDTDGDGIDDEHDSCKTIPGSAKYNGCPVPDRDKDGVNDEDDKCPDQPGAIENNGCPVVAAPQKMEYDGGKILFQSSSSRLTAGSYPSLNALADTLRIHPTWHLTIGGHADSTGNAAKNLILSQQRADAVKAYLVKKGISAGRITAVGYGQEKPLGNNKTNAGKAANRRVELKLEAEK